MCWQQLQRGKVPRIDNMIRYQRMDKMIRASLHSGWLHNHEYNGTTLVQDVCPSSKQLQHLMSSDRSLGNLLVT